MTVTPPAATLPRRPGAPACRFCGVPLTPHQAARGGPCGAAACETRRVQEASRQVFHRNWSDYVERQRLGIEAAAAEVASAVRELGQPPETIAFGVVPHQDRPVHPLPDERLLAFEAHLEAIIARAFDAGEPPQPDLRRREAEEEAENPLIDATCATCQGKCCFLGGGTDAFLTVETIQLYRWRNPEATADEVRARYLSQLPGRSVEHSCVYHGERGCTLSRHDRADICNRYHCNPQSDLLRRFRAMGASSAVIVGNEDDAGPNVGIYDAAGWRRHEAPGDLDGEDGDSPELVGRTVAAAIAQAPPDMPGDLPPTRPAEPACAWCGAAIDRHKAVTRQSCGRPDCERRRVAELTAEFERRKTARHAALVRRTRDEQAAEIGRAAGALGLRPDDVTVGVVPVLEARPEPVPPARRAAFAAHLDRILAAAFAGDPAPGEDEATDHAAPEPDLAVAACAACRGSCCRGGGDTGYLSEEELLRLRRRDPGARPEEIRARYLDLVPPESVRGSCVFHGTAGCTLPRELRSPVCNGFVCRGLETLLAERDGAGPRAALIVAADDDDVPRRVTVYDARSGETPAVNETGLATGRETA